MAPTELQPTYSGGYNKSVAALFGDDGDSQPLWFKKDAFGEHDFDTESYIADLRRFVPFDTLKAELRNHQAALKHELVELINRDYADFVNLSTKLVDVDGAVLRMRLPLNELRGKLLLVRESVQESLASLQDGLKRRAEASASREVLELLLDTSHVVSKVVPRSGGLFVVSNRRAYLVVDCWSVVVAFLFCFGSVFWVLSRCRLSLSV